MSGDSASFFLLDERIRRFLWLEGWEALRDAQEKAIPLIVNADRDVIVAAATAAGKTEAAFLPALTHILHTEPLGLIVYISPLKALINDQFGRLDRLCEQLEVPVWPWHGDISASTKTIFLNKRQGVLLITPESLEALLCNRGTSVKAVFERVAFFVVDELHAFIGAERGKQLQSLIHRVEKVIGKTVPRIGLSATLGDMSLAAEYLRPHKGAEVALVKSDSGASELKILVKGYEEPASIRPGNRQLAAPEETDLEPDADGDEPDEVSPALIAAHLFKGLRGSNNLVFPNARREVERYTHLLNVLCEHQQVPNEFWPHHGSLSKEIRAETEVALKAKERPATAICTNTLELGIDIGAVKSVAQIGPPPSVASLRQRLGRSGRRTGEPAILRGYCVERELEPGISLATALRLNTVRMVAMISLLIEGWFEPPMVRGMHISTLVQQMLSFVAQNGGAMIGELYQLLCAPGAPFAGVTKDEFKGLVRHLGQQEVLMQDSSGLLLHGQLGARLVNHHTFYAAFTTDEEYRIVAGAKPLGTLPVSQMLTTGQRILFAGKTWVVEHVDDQRKTIFVVRTRGGVPPLFNGGVGRTHTKVRQRMRDLLESSEATPAFLDATTKRFLEEARANYVGLRLNQDFMVDQGREVMLMTWLGDSANEAIACILRFKGITAHATEVGVEIRKLEQSTPQVLDAVLEAAIDDLPPLDDLLADAKNLRREKWDWALPDDLMRKTYASLCLDLDEGLNWLRDIERSRRTSSSGDVLPERLEAQ
jgi:ATP-dependent Lhr-like helicase